MAIVLNSRGNYLTNALGQGFNQAVSTASDGFLRRMMQTEQRDYEDKIYKQRMKEKREYETGLRDIETEKATKSRERYADSMVGRGYGDFMNVPEGQTPERGFLTESLMNMGVSPDMARNAIMAGQDPVGLLANVQKLNTPQKPSMPSSYQEWQLAYPDGSLGYDAFLSMKNAPEPSIKIADGTIYSVQGGNVQPLGTTPKRAEEIRSQTEKKTDRQSKLVNNAVSKIQDIDKVLGFMQDSSWDTGVRGFMSGFKPGGDRNTLLAMLKPIQSDQAFSTLQQMREMSDTGGALGSVSERELALLESTIASLDPNASEQYLRDSLNKIRKSYENVLNIINGNVTENQAQSMINNQVSPIIEVNY